MEHPTTAPGGWELEYLVYPGGPGQIAIGVLRHESQPEGLGGRTVTRRMMGLRWCEGDERIPTWQEGAHDWFVLPFTFAAAITRSLLQMKGADFPDLDEAGMQKLIEWMTESGRHAIDDCLCY